MIATLAVIVAIIAVLIAVEYARVAKAADAPKTVYGVVYDETDQPVAGATVTVTMKYGSGSTRSQLTYGPTETDGYYLVIFADTQWMEHDTIEVIASESGLGVATNSTEATVAGSQQVDVHFSELIPEFVSPAFVTLAVCAIVLFFFRGLKNGGRRTQRDRG